MQMTPDTKIHLIYKEKLKLKINLFMVLKFKYFS